MSKRRETITDSQLGWITVAGLALTVGSIWWMRGLPLACFVLGVILLGVAWSCAGKEE